MKRIERKRRGIEIINKYVSRFVILITTEKFWCGGEAYYV
jgi:hypothetical protein